MPDTPDSTNQYDHSDLGVEDEVATPAVAPEAKAVEPPPEATPEVTPEPKPADTPPAKPLTAVAKPKHPRSLRALALQFGATPEEIDATGTDELDEWVEWRQSQQAKPAPKAEETDEDEAIIAEMEKEGAYDDKMIGLLKRTVAKNKKIRDDLRAREERDAQREFIETDNAIDDTFDALPAAMKPFVGSGYRQDLGPDSDEFHMRKAIVAAAGIDYAKDSRAVIKRKVEASAKRVLGKLAKEEPKPAEKTNGNRISKEAWDAAAVGAPADRAKPLQKGRARAEAAAEKKLKELGIHEDDDEPVELQGMLD